MPIAHLCTLVLSPMYLRHLLVSTTRPCPSNQTLRRQRECAIYGHWQYKALACTRFLLFTMNQRLFKRALTAEEINEIQRQKDDARMAQEKIDRAREQARIQEIQQQEAQKQRMREEEQAQKDAIQRQKDELQRQKDAAILVGANSTQADNASKDVNANRNPPSMAGNGNASQQEQAPSSTRAAEPTVTSVAPFQTAEATILPPLSSSKQENSSSDGMTPPLQLALIITSIILFILIGVSAVYIVKRKRAAALARETEIEEDSTDEIKDQDRKSSTTVTIEEPSLQSDDVEQFSFEIRPDGDDEAIYSIREDI